MDNIASMASRWLRRPDNLLALAVLLLALGVYTATLGPTIDFWDCGEFVTTSHIVGVPHQPGTPLYVLVGRVFDMVLGQPDLEQPSLRTAWAVNFMSAVFSSLAVMMVYLIIVRVARRNDPDAGWLASAGGLVGALFLLFSETFWNNAIEAEVYGLAAFMMTTLAWVGLVWYDHRTERRSDWLLLLLLYLCGLGVGFHLGSLLVYPAFFLMVWLATDRQLPVLDLALMSAGLALFLASTTFITDTDVLITLITLYALGCAARALWPQILSWTGRRDADQRQARPFALFGLLLFVTGLSVHAVLMIRAGAVPEPAINQTVPSDFATLMSVIRREQYPPLNPLERQAELSFQFGYFYDFLMRQYSYLPQPGALLDKLSIAVGPLLLALLGLAHTVRRARPVAWLLVLAYLINADGLTLYLNFTDHEVRERDYFYFAAFLFGSVFIGLGAAALLRWTSGPLGKSLGQLERDAAAPPAGRPFHLAGFLYRIVAALVASLVLMAMLGDDAKTRWLGLWLFGGAFAGLGLGPVLDGLVAKRRGEVTAAWNDRPWAERAVLGGLLAAAFTAGAYVLNLFAAGGVDRVFAIGLYVMSFGGMFLGYGERLGGPRPPVVLAWPRPVRGDVLSRVAAAALAVLAALPVIGLADPDLHDKFFRHDRSDNRIAYEYARNILAGLDENAVVFTNGDNDTFPIWYLQEVEHFRRDVTVVNLSLVNLPWYVKQLKRLDNPVDLTYSDAEIDDLRPVAYRDRETGEPVIVYVRDYVVKDIIDANRRRGEQRPIYFAVTIPRENMARYYEFLQMEGLAYRLTEQRSADGLPGTDPERLLANVFGAYSFDALLDGDSAARWQEFARQAGFSTDQPPYRTLTHQAPPPTMDYGKLLDMMGEPRTDIYRERNTVNLLGNYPASIARAGFGYLARAEDLRQPDGSVADADTTAYDGFTDRAVFCYEMALKFDPYNGLVAAGYYPTLLLEHGRLDDALAYLESIHNRIAPELERSAVLNAMRGLVTTGLRGVAINWLNQRTAAETDWRLGYELLFRIYEAEGDMASAAATVELWRQRNGSDHAELRRALEEMRQRARDQEQRRLEDAVRGALPEGGR